MVVVVRWESVSRAYVRYVLCVSKHTRIHAILGEIVFFLFFFCSLHGACTYHPSCARIILTHTYAPPLVFCLSSLVLCMPVSSSLPIPCLVTIFFSFSIMRNGINWLWWQKYQLRSFFGFLASLSSNTPSLYRVIHIVICSRSASILAPFLIWSPSWHILLTAFLFYFHSISIK